jgi:hypothetical protein
VTIHTDDDRQWNVSPALLTLTGRHILDEAPTKTGQVVPFSSKQGQTFAIMRLASSGVAGR